MHTEALTSALKMDHEDGIHQAIMDVVYDDWQSARGCSYADMLANATTKYGKLATLATLLGKYNQQVTNGGHQQYWDNGYASAKTGGCFARHDDTELHELMVTLFEEFGLKALKNGNVIYSLMVSFLGVACEGSTCEDCDGAGGWDEEVYDNEDEEARPVSVWEDCHQCGGGGEVEGFGNGDHLDSAYYEVYEEWMLALEGFFRAQITG